MSIARATAVLLVSLAAGGCSLPGSKNRPVETPTQIGLSLYASPTVNPNPDSAQPEPTGPALNTPALPSAVTVDPALQEGPYLVNLSGNSKTELAEKMRALLDYLQTGNVNGGALPPPSSLRFSTQGTPLADAMSATAMPPLVAPGAPTIPLPTLWSLPPGSKPQRIASSPPLPLDASDDAGLTSRDAGQAPPALGQYANSPAGLASDQDGNANVQLISVATPIVFKILQLKDDSVFLNADHDELVKDLKKALGSTYVADDDYVLQPGQFKYIDFSDIDKKTRYVAVFANFHNLDGATWKQAIRLESKNYRYALLVTFEGSRVAIVDESYRPPPPRKTP